jgi:drug/metabolite transporter (DMT)-like permease
VVVVAGGLVGPVLLAAGLARTSSATAALLLNLELAATTALAAAVFRGPVARRSAAGASLVAVAGAALVWSAPLPWTGALLVVAACGCWAVDDCAAALLDGVTPQQVTLAKGVLAGGVNLAVGLVVAGLPGAGPALLALGVGAAGYGVSIALWIGGARDLGPDRAPLVFASAPFMGAVVAWTAFDQPITGPQLVAGLLAAAGVALVAVPARRPEPRFAAFDPASSPAFTAVIVDDRDDADDLAVEGAGHYGYLDEYDDLFDEGLVPLRRSG